VPPVDGEILVAGDPTDPQDYQPLGSEGCMARALEAGHMLANASVNLNAHIDPEWEYRKLTTPTVPRDHVGIDNEQWHVNCVVRAMVQAYGHDNFEFRKLKGPRWWYELQVNPGTYLVVGVLNWKYRGPNKHIYYQVGCGDDKPADFPANWLHCVAVKNNHVIDHTGLHRKDGRLPVHYLLQDQRRGYFHTITKVYRFEKLSK
jgi:hypothetical protein